VNTDRYVVGYAGRGKVMYGYDDNSLEWSWVLPLSGIREAERKRREVEGDGPEEAIIYRLVPVRRVKAKNKT